MKSKSETPTTSVPRLELPRFELPPLDVPRLRLPVLPAWAERTNPPAPGLASPPVELATPSFQGAPTQAAPIQAAPASLQVEGPSVALSTELRTAPEQRAPITFHDAVTAQSERRALAETSTQRNVCHPTGNVRSVDTPTLVSPASRTAPQRQADPAPVATDTGLPPIALGLLVICAGLLVYVGNMAGSSALLACAALIFTDLAISASASPAAPQHRLRLISLAAAIGLAGFAAFKATHQFSEMAFVAGLLVVMVLIPVLVLHIASSLLLRRKADSIASQTLKMLSVGRIVALLITLFAGYQAFHSFSARPDGIATIAVLALVAINARYLFLSRAR